MILAGEPLAVLDLHHLPGQWMERIEDAHLDCRTPGIVTLVRPASAKAGSPARSATRLAGMGEASSTIGRRACSRHWRSPAATAAMAACSKPSRASNS
jgi:hypothetical protein